MAVRLAVIMPRGEDGHYGVEPIVAAEQGGRVHAATPVGALGIVEPATALELARRLEDWALHVATPPTEDDEPGCGKPGHKGHEGHCVTCYLEAEDAP